jgi:hypothetical protein
MAALEPQSSTFDGDDPDGYALSVNINRRHLSKGQRAMAVAKVYYTRSQQRAGVANS